ncbi:nitroreductase family protein [Anaerolineales bacterium]
MAQALMDLMVSRRSIRRYKPIEPEKHLIQAVLEAAIWAPSAHNRQPWRFAVIRQGSVKVKLAQAMGARLRSDLEKDGAAADFIQKECERSFERISSAPVLILMALSMVDMDHYSDSRRNQNEEIMAIQSVAMAGQNLLLRAHELGLGACWMCAPLFCPDVVQESLGLPEDWQAQGLITMGYPDQVREKERQIIESRTLWF